MATTFKTFLNNDVTTTKTLLHEAIPITGAIVSGTYDAGSKNAGKTPTERNIKNFSHGMFQSVYDYPYLSSSANHIFDISVGISAHSNLSGTINGVADDHKHKRTSATHTAEQRTKRTQQEKKIAMYNQMAQILMGHDRNGNIQRFDSDGRIEAGDTDKMDEVIFINFSRLLVKDEIKKGSFQIQFGTNPTFKSGNGLQGAVGTTNILTIADVNAQNDFRINSPAGEYGILSASHTARASAKGQHLDGTAGQSGKVGLIFYQAGVCVLTASIFQGGDVDGAVGGGGMLAIPVSMSMGGLPTYHGITEVASRGIQAGTMSASIDVMLTGSKIQNIANNIRRRIHDISFNNTTELNSTTLYACTCI